MADLLGGFPITRADKLGCARREVKKRKAAYNYFVMKGKMTRDEADREIRVMESIVVDYERGSIEDA